VTDLPDFNPEDVEAEVIEHEQAATERSSARRVALQALYEIDCADHAIGDVITTRLQEEPVSKKAARYVRRLVVGVVDNRDKLDTVIGQYASEWPLEQVAIVDRNILRMAVYEFARQSNTPVNVVIAEAIELAKLFGAEATPRFVNGVLGSLANDGDAIRAILPPEADEGDE
jgi:N utilization substance protein B